MEQGYQKETPFKLRFDKKRFHVKHCPCGKNNKDGKFCPYVGYEDKGFCFSCGETFLPELSQNSIPYISHSTSQFVNFESILKSFSTVSLEVFNQSLSCYEANHFVNFLRAIFGKEITDRVIKKYCIGTSKHWKGATVFWQVSKEGNADKRIRSGKIMLYNSITGRRSQKNYHHPNWVHSVLQLPAFVLKQCFFGEHLLIELHKTVGIVEAEKTAIICSIYFPSVIWIATGGKHGAKWWDKEVCAVLRGRDVVLYPDLNAHEDWQKKSKVLVTVAKTCMVSNLLESKATEQERKAGLDLADYLLQFSYKEFLQQNY